MASLVLIGSIWYSAYEASTNGKEYRVTLSGTESIGKSRYFTCTLDGNRERITYSPPHQIGDVVSIVRCGNKSFEGDEKTPSLVLAI